MADETPHGCLGCNKDAVEAFFKAQGLPLDVFKEVPRPRHKWNDVICCPECGKAWLKVPKPEGERIPLDDLLR